MYISIVQTKDPLGWDLPEIFNIYDPQTFQLMNLVKDYKAILHTKYQASEPSGSEVDFLNIIFYVCLCFKC